MVSPVFVYLFLVVLWFELRASHLLGKLEPLCQHCLVLGIFEIGSRKLFALGWLRTTILLISAS
jgi:hypothetical protein